MKISLQAISSSTDSSYTVDHLVSDEGKLSVFCDCPAGQWGKFCKHKWRLLHGDETMLADLSQIEALKEVAQIALDRSIDSLYGTVEEHEKKKKKLAKSVKKEKEIRNHILAKKDIVSPDSYFEISSELFELEREQSYTTYLIAKNKEVVEKKLKEGF